MKSASEHMKQMEFYDGTVGC